MIKSSDTLPAEPPPLQPQVKNEFFGPATPSPGTASIPLSPDAAVKLGRDKHASVILATAARLGMASGFWVRPFLHSVPAEPIREIIQDMEGEFIGDILIKKKVLSPEQFLSQVEPIVATATKHLAEDEKTTVNSIHLANPLIPSDKVASLMLPLPRESSIRAALMANSNCPPELAPPNENTTQFAWQYEKALAMYGDLSNPFTKKTIEGLLEPETPSVGEDSLRSHIEDCQTLLAAREDLPASIIKQLDAVARPEVFQILIKSASHQSLVKSGHLSGMNKQYPGEDWRLFISPVVGIGGLQAKWRETEDSEAVSKQMIAAHPNAYTFMVDEIIHKRIPGYSTTFPTQLIENQSSNTERAVNALKKLSPSAKYPSTIGSLVDISPETLVAAYNEAVEDQKWSRAAACMCNKKFQWRKHDQFPPELRQSMIEEDLMAALAARAVSGMVSQDDCDNAIKSSQSATALLFAQNLSSRRIGKIVENHPQLTALAAVHPNGFDVSTKDLAPEIRVVVERNRTTPLPGPSSNPCNSKQSDVLSI